MKVLILPQVAKNKGDRAILHFMIEGFVENNVKDITVATSNPLMWNNYNKFKGGRIKFICDTWMTYAQIESKVPYRSVRYYLVRGLSKLKASFYQNIGHSLIRAAVVNQRFISIAKLMCYLCNKTQWNALKNADAVVTTGGHRITTLLQPDVVGPQTFGMAMVVLACKKLYLWSQTIGSFNFKNEKNRALIKKIITNSERIYVRDLNSVQELKGFQTDESKVWKTYDSVFGLRHSVRKYCDIPPSKRKRILGISVYTGKSGRMIEYRQYINSLSELVKTVVKEGFRVWFFPMHIADRQEQQYFTDIIEQSGCNTQCTVVDSRINTIEHLKQLAKCKVFVGHKTHSIIFALVTATPLIAIGYHIKAMDFMRQFGLDEYCFMEKETLPMKLITIYEKIMINLDEVYVIESQKSDQMCHKVRKDFKHLIDELNDNYHN